MDAARGSIFQANLAALAALSPTLARAVLAAEPRADLEFVETDEGVPGATLGAGAQGRALASRRRPLEEGRALAGTVNLTEAAGVLVLGLGLGYHARALAERLPAASQGEPLAPWGVIVIFEPDVPLLRAVFERIDHSAWLRRGDVVIVTEPTQAAIAGAMQRREALPFLGTDVAVMEHPAQRSRLGASAGEFVGAFREWIGAARTTVRTTLLNCGVTIRNELMNLDRYATRAGVADLAGAARGRPAIVVAAGPSLRRNLHLLKRPGIRDRFVIVAVQTVLKTLLAEGIRAHFVTALDYHEVSRRFYEGLDAPAVEGVTLVAEAKANPAILSAFPGDIRIPASPLLEELIGEDLSRVLGHFKQGPTVAHMAYSFARNVLGCDPVILIGQDLAFTDGQYYGAGAAIHRVWGSELSEFRSLEMMEWERIVRGRFDINPGQPNLRRRPDALGRPVYLDEQMATYLAQFERDFREDAARGLATIDATEGGVAKAGTTAMPLAEALEQFSRPERIRLPEPPGEPDAAGRLRRTEARVRSVRAEVLRIAQHAREAAKLIQEIIRHQHDQARAGRLIGRAQALAAEVADLRPAFALVQHYNQAGSLKRVRADRAIMLDGLLSPVQRQRKELERDLVNVEWLGDAADELGALLDATIRMLGGGERFTGELPGRSEQNVRDALGEAAPGKPVGVSARPVRARIAAVIPAELSRGGLGSRRDLREPLHGGRSPLCCVVERLARCREIDGIVILAEDPAEVAALVAPMARLAQPQIVPVGRGALSARTSAVAAARLWSAPCWRGGLGGLTVYDEVCDPVLLAPILEERRFDAGAVVGADWPLIDPALVDAAAARFREGMGKIGGVRLVFCQAPPGLGTCIIDRTLLRELAANASAGSLATIGGRLSYSPLVPMPDPLANLRAEANGKPVCVTAPPAARDCGLRFTADSTPGRALLARLLQHFGSAWTQASAEQIALAAVTPTTPTTPKAARNAPPPREFVLELCTGRLTSGPRGRWLRGGSEAVERPPMNTRIAERILRQMGECREDAVVTFFGAGDPLCHPDLLRLVAVAKAAELGVHIRTDLLCDADRLGPLLESGADVISVDLMAEAAPTYRALMGADLFDRARANLSALLEQRLARPAPGGLPLPWIVPRATRCDAVYEEIEAFYDRWLLGAGAAAIDPLPLAIPGERIEPLPVPEFVSGRTARERMVIRSDGRVVPGGALDFSTSRAGPDMLKTDLLAAHRKSLTVAPQPHEPAEAADVAGSRARQGEPALASPVP